jgi:hypothetical protein
VRCSRGHGRFRPYCAVPPRLAVRSALHDGDVVFSTDAIRDDIYAIVDESRYAGIPGLGRKNMAAIAGRNRFTK